MVKSSFGPAWVVSISDDDAPSHVVLYGHAGTRMVNATIKDEPQHQTHQDSRI